MNIFISYKYENRKNLNDLKSFMLNPQPNFGHYPIMERDDVREQGKEEIKKYLRPLLKKAEILICLVGKDTHSSPWVKYEINVAKSQKKPVIPVRIPGTSGGIPASIKSLIEIDFDPKAIQDAINSAYSSIKKS